MRRQIQIGLLLLICSFAIGGSFIYLSISNATHTVKEISFLQKLELLQDKLETRIEIVQSNLKDITPSEKSISAYNLNQMVKAAEECSLCLESHHTKENMHHIRDDVDQYLLLIRQTQALSNRPDAFGRKKREAITYGTDLVHGISRLSQSTPEALSEHIDAINQQMAQARDLIFTILILGPLIIIVGTVLFLRRFTGSIDTLVKSTQTFDPINLNYQIDAPLKNEFKTLAGSFNEMVQSLKEHRQDLSSLQMLYRTLFESAGDAICIIDTAEDNFAIIISVNQAASEIYGYPINELQGMSCLELSPDDKRDELLNKMELIMTGKWLRFETERRHRDGSTFIAEMSAGPLILEDHFYILSFARDITERVQAEKELLRANQMAVAGQMAVGLAHEIKNPLAGIKASVEVLVDELDLDPADKNLLGRVINEVNRVEKLLRSLLSYARPPQPHFDHADLNKLLDTVIHNVEISASKAHGKNIEFIKDFKENEIKLEMDAAQIQQVFLNILLNALDAIASQGQVTISSRLESENAVVTIKDNGKGMSNETLQSIFIPFFSTKKKGTGLGLSLSRRLIEQHGGTIDASSAQDQGSEFVIKLPHSKQDRG